MNDSTQVGTTSRNLGRWGPHIAIVGHSRHGKDEAALTLHKTGKFKLFGSTSWAALPDIAGILNLPEQIAWEQRHEIRQFWKDECDKLRANNPCHLIERVLRRGNICSGIRDKIELQTALDRGYFKHVLWIERRGFPADSTVTFGWEMATEVIHNDGSLLDFREKILMWAWQAGLLTDDDCRHFWSL